MSNTILEIHAKQTGFINRTITSKYKEIIEDVRFYMASGYEIEEAVKVAFNEWAWKFESNEDKALLLSWLDGSFGRNAA